MKLLWLDVETTGLDPKKDHILEVAWAWADLEKPFTLGAMSSYAVHYRTGTVLGIDPYVVTMHGKNNLWNECEATNVEIGDVENFLLSEFPKDVPRSEMTTLAGSSVHFDLGFLREHMPRVAKQLSHRVYDVSAVKLFCRSLGMANPLRAEAHRAAPDVLESVSHAVICADWLRMIHA